MGSVSHLFPLVSLASMLAPSPDSFIGVSGDAGTDTGRTCEAPDQGTRPREPIRRIEWAPFRVAGDVRQVGTYTFTRR